MIKNLILASASPRRREILLTAGYKFGVVPSYADEVKIPGDVYSSVTENALAKAKEVYNRLGDKNNAVLGADTLVCYNGEIMGKPKNEADAMHMLLNLSGTVHEVITGYSVVSDNFCKSGYCVTKVRFRDLTEAEIKKYVATGEPLDKAGAYGIQERGCVLVESIEGDYFNVMGLPVASVYNILAELGILPC